MSLQTVRDRHPSHPIRPARSAGRTHNAGSAAYYQGQATPLVLTAASASDLAFAPAAWGGSRAGACGRMIMGPLVSASVGSAFRGLPLRKPAGVPSNTGGGDGDGAPVASRNTISSPVAIPRASRTTLGTVT